MKLFIIKGYFHILKRLELDGETLKGLFVYLFVGLVFRPANLSLSSFQTASKLIRMEKGIFIFQFVCLFVVVV